RHAIELAPDVDHPHRRACSTLSELRRNDEAIVECEAALRLAPDSGYDKISLASALGRRHATGDIDRAHRLAREAAEQLPDDVTVLALGCELELRSQDLARLAACSDRLLAADPQGVEALSLGVIAAAVRNDLYLARQRLEQARAAGLDDERYRQL